MDDDEFGDFGDFDQGQSASDRQVTQEDQQKKDSDDFGNVFSSSGDNNPASQEASSVDNN